MPLTVKTESTLIFIFFKINSKQKAMEVLTKLVN